MEKYKIFTNLKTTTEGRVGAETEGLSDEGTARGYFPVLSPARRRRRDNQLILRQNCHIHIPYPLRPSVCFCHFFTSSPLPHTPPRASGSSFIANSCYKKMPIRSRLRISTDDKFQTSGKEKRFRSTLAKHRIIVL